MTLVSRNKALLFKMWMCYVSNLAQVVEDVLSGKIEGKPYKTDEPPVQKKRVKVDIWR